MPFDDLSDPQDGWKFIIVDVGMVTDSDEGFPDVGDEISFGIFG